MPPGPLWRSPSDKGARQVGAVRAVPVSHENPDNVALVNIEAGAVSGNSLLAPTLLLKCNRYVPTYYQELSNIKPNRYNLQYGSVVIV